MPGRQRLGDVGLEHLFHQLASAWVAQPPEPDVPDQSDALHGLHGLAVDGVVWSAPDTQANRQALECCSNQHGLVRQEIWGVLIAYTLLRRQMRLMAGHVKVAPSRMGFHAAAGAIIDILRFAPLEAAANLPRRLALLLEQAHLFALPPRRQRCAYPRAVKLRPAKYPVRKKMPVRLN